MIEFWFFEDHEFIGDPVDPDAAQYVLKSKCRRLVFEQKIKKDIWLEIPPSAKRQLGYSLLDLTIVDVMRDLEKPFSHVPNEDVKTVRIEDQFWVIPQTTSSYPSESFTGYFFDIDSSHSMGLSTGPLLTASNEVYHLPDSMACFRTLPYHKTSYDHFHNQTSVALFKIPSLRNLRLAKSCSADPSLRASLSSALRSLLIERDDTANWDDISTRLQAVLPSVYFSTASLSDLGELYLFRLLLMASVVCEITEYTFWLRIFSLRFTARHIHPPSYPVLRAILELPSTAHLLTRCAKFSSPSQDDPHPHWWQRVSLETLIECRVAAISTYKRGIASGSFVVSQRAVLRAFNLHLFSVATLLSFHCSSFDLNAFTSIASQSYCWRGKCIHPQCVQRRTMLASLVSLHQLPHSDRNRIRTSSLIETLSELCIRVISEDPRDFQNWYSHAIIMRTLSSGFQSYQLLSFFTSNGILFEWSRLEAKRHIHTLSLEKKSHSILDRHSANKLFLSTKSGYIWEELAGTTVRIHTIYDSLSMR